MKLFYTLGLLVAIGLTLLPLFILPSQSQDRYRGQVVSFNSYGDEIKSLDPATCGDTASASMQGNCYEGLYCYHYLKRPLEVIPQLAAEMPKISPDGLTYTIRLKSGVKFFPNPCFGLDPNGGFKTRTVRAEDFVLSFKRAADYYINPGLAWAFLSERVVGLDQWREKSKDYARGDFSRYDLPVEGIKALDDLTLQIKLRENFPQMIYVLAMNVYAPIPREAVDYWLGTAGDGAGGRKALPPEKRTTEFREAEQVVGTGPYVLSTFIRRGEIVFARNPNFREEFYPREGAPGDAEAGLLRDAGKKVPFIDVLHYDFVAEDYSAWQLFLTRQVDATGIPKENYEFVITPGKELADKWQKRHIFLNKYESPAVYWLAFNMDDPVLGKSKSLREALCLAFDVENYIKVLHNGRGVRSVNILPSSFKGHDEAGPGPYYRLDRAAAKQKIEQAKAELAAAGKLVDGGIPPLTLDLGSTDSATRDMGEFARQQFAQAGVELKVNLNEWPVLQEKVHNKKTQIYAMGWHADYPDAENFLQLFYSKNIAKGTNDTNYSNPAFDALYEQVRVMPDTPQRTALYARMVNMISDDCPVLLLSEPLSFVLFSDWVQNVKSHPIGYGFSKYRRIDTQLREKLGGRSE
ncbi:MAG: ABC transporter substrate-binding protein [Phycisphaerae bacterium]|jgi:ABC-type transport system substrate-binding protein